MLCLSINICFYTHAHVCMSEDYLYTQISKEGSMFVCADVYFNICTDMYMICIYVYMICTDKYILHQ